MKDYFGLKGKVCVITGSASGMAKAATEMLVDLGAKVYALDWTEVTVPGIEKYVSVNLGEKNSIDKAFLEIPDKIDVFLGVAGVSGQKHDFITTFAIDFISNKYIVEKYLEERIVPGGTIGFVTSEAGLRWETAEAKEEYMMAIDAKSWDEAIDAIRIYKDVPGPAGYSLAKRAMHYYIASILEKFGPKKIRVNAVLSGATDTGLTDEFAVSTGGRENLEKYTGFAQRLAQAREMAEPLVFLCSNMASYVSGTLMTVDFGLDLPMVAGITQDWYGGLKIPK